MKILALDQSSTKTGYSLFNDNEELIAYGLLKLTDITNKNYGNVAYDERVENNRQFLIKCIDFYKPDIVVFEDIQKQTNIKTYKDLAYLQGVLKNCCYIQGISYSILKPSEWRNILKIKGKGREILKQKSIDYIKNKFNFVATEDECEAICIGQACIELLRKGKLIIYKDN